MEEEVLTYLKIKQLEAKETDRADLTYVAKSQGNIHQTLQRVANESGKRVVVTKLNPRHRKVLLLLFVQPRRTDKKVSQRLQIVVNPQVRRLRNHLGLFLGENQLYNRRCLPKVNRRDPWHKRG